MFPPYNTACGKVSIDTFSDVQRMLPEPSDIMCISNFKANKDTKTVVVLIGVCNLSAGGSKHPYIDISDITTELNYTSARCKALWDRINNITREDSAGIRLSGVVGSAEYAIWNEAIDSNVTRLNPSTDALLKLIRISNASSTLGVLEFLDNMAKMATVKRICTFPPDTALTIDTLTHAKQMGVNY
jgi:hypothetical protein